ncbi:MAG: hypothetical protein HKM24_04850, partial [Gammaproteobacteria bacterium]|nr:hypothetical protein [Gammaproteobacteria bacterium]
MTLSISRLQSLAVAISYAFLVVASQLSAQPLLSQIWGYSQTSDIVIICLVFVGFLLGLSGLIKPKPYKIILLFSLAFNLLLAFFFTPLLLACFKSFPLKLIFSVSALSLTVVSGLLLARYMFKDKAFDKSYFLLHITALIIVIAMTITIKQANNMVLYSAISVALFVAIITPFKIDFVQPKLSLTKWACMSIIYGATASLFVNYFFNLRSLTTYTSGLEFNFYLIFAFAFLALAGLINKPLSRLHIALPTLYVIALALATLTLFALIWPEGQEFLVDLTDITVWFNSLGLGYLGHIGFMSLILFIPYLLLCLSVPSQQAHEKSINHLFYVTLGNILGHVLFILPVVAVGIATKLVCFSVAILLLVLINPMGKAQRIVSTLITLICLTSLMFSYK